MKSKKISISVRVLVLVFCLLNITACRDMFDVLPEDTIDHTKAYQNIYDADAAVLGVYGQLLNIAKQYEVLNELRADLVDVTGNADTYLKEINNHQVSSANPYANPKPFYAVILNCNDVLKNLQIMYENKRINKSEFDQRYSDIGALRSWIYFQVGVHYGEIPYVTEAIENIDDVKDASKFPRIKLDELVSKLIAFMESLPYKDVYAVGNSLNTQLDGYPSKLFFVNKYCVLGDLYLWSDNYAKAAHNYKNVLETTTPLGESAGDNYYNAYVGSSGDVDEIKPGSWQTFFSRSPQDNQYQWEWVWSMVFDSQFQPKNPFIDLFSNAGGSYLLKPSTAAISNWMQQDQTDNTPYDLRGLDNSYKIINGQPVIMKFLYNYLNATTGVPGKLLERNGKWFLYRASLVHLRYAEAANREGHDKIAYALINQGIKTTYAYNPNTTDATQKQATFLDWPYDLDARKIDAPRLRGKYHRNLGIRGRMRIKVSGLSKSDSSAYFNGVDENASDFEPLYTNRTVKDRAGLTQFMENKIIDEAALELAFEGNRWQDLFRIARRMEKEGKNGLGFLNGKLKTKNPGFSAKGSMNDWFLPFTW
ncbi:RagB/SusD family nutrient uptake outer membrane protein [Arcticibacter sp.]|uniref:RagB/SusD family nutrient uptake outer membrane protein n=1 Tax=Arcticibacter sp. TaxID=1872630 RepID=UPI00388D3355